MKLKTPLATAALALLLTACGGGTDQEPPTAATPVGATAVEPPLLDDEGRPTMAVAGLAPADAAARTREGRYASATQAAALEAALGDRALVVDVGHFNGDADVAVGLVHALQAAHDLGNDAPVLVHGADARLAALVADRLAASGLRLVWVVA